MSLAGGLVIEFGVMSEEHSGPLLDKSCRAVSIHCNSMAYCQDLSGV